MESKTKLFGHPVHPMLIVFPLGLLSTAVVFDALYLSTRRTALATVAYWNLVAGIVGALAAAPFGLRDWLAIPEGTRAKSVGQWHGLGNTLASGLFGASWLLRRRDPHYRPTTAAFALSTIAMLMSLVTAWLGGELVDRLGVGVDEGAHLNSPSSLSAKPATAH